MLIDVISSINEARSDDFTNKTAIVIDVLRATSNMVTALAHGVRDIVPVETVQQAKQLQDGGCLLGGERFCKKIAGFDIGNSPFEYQSDIVRGKTIVMTTTNGTRAIQKSQKACRVLAGSLLNARAAAEAAADFKRDILIVCAGAQDAFALEDGLCAGLVVEELLRLYGKDEAVNDFGLAMLGCYRQRAHSLPEALRESSGGKRLARLGFEADIEYCSSTNVYDTVPMLKDGRLLPLAPTPRQTARSIFATPS